MRWNGADISTRVVASRLRCETPWNLFRRGCTNCVIHIICIYFAYIHIHIYTYTYIHNIHIRIKTILAERYFKRRALRLVSLESSPSVEYGLKKIFFNFVFFTGSYRGINFWEKYSEFHYFYSHFQEFSPKISSILLKLDKIFKNSVVDFILKGQNIV